MKHQDWHVNTVYAKQETINQIVRLSPPLERHHLTFLMNFDHLYLSEPHHLHQTLHAAFPNLWVSLFIHWTWSFIFIVDISAENITIRKPTTGRDPMGSSNGTSGVPIGTTTRGAVRPDHQNIHFTSKLMLLYRVPGTPAMSSTTQWDVPSRLYY